MRSAPNREQPNSESKKKRRSLIVSITLLSVTLPLVLLFQNCTQGVVADDAKSALEAQAGKLDFFYEPSFDQIGFMSCNQLPPGSFDASAYFTLRAGAYQNGGLALKSTFYDDPKINRKPREKQIELLNLSPANSNSTVQMALRINSSLQTAMVRDSAVTADTDYVNLLMPLGTDQMSSTMVKLPKGTTAKVERSDYRPEGWRFEGSFYWGNNDSQLERLREFFRNSGALGLTFTQGGGTGDAAMYARSPVDVFPTSTIDSTRFVYGRAYDITLSQPSATTIHTNFPNSAITAVRERSYMGTNESFTPKGWACPSNLQFRIIRDADLSNPFTQPCVKKVDPSPGTLDANSRYAFKILRNTLRVEDWYVDLDNRCIIAKKKQGRDCYGQFTSVTYNMGDACAREYDSNNPSAGACLAFASICYRL